MNDGMVDPSAAIHPLAHLGGEVIIGARTRVWQFASVIRSAMIGEDCNIGDGAIVDGAEVGDRCIVSHGAFIDPGIKIGNDVFIGPQVSLCNDFWPKVSKDGWFDIQKLISGETVVTIIEDGASVGANAVVMPGVVIGKGAMIAAGAVVQKDVPAGCLYQRNDCIQSIDPNRVIIRMREARR